MFDPRSEDAIVVIALPPTAESNQPSNVNPDFVAGSKVIGNVSSALNVAGLFTLLTPPSRLYVTV